MKLTAVVFAALLQFCATEATPVASGPNAGLVPSPLPARVLTHPRDLVRRDGRDCGKWNLKCKGAEGACNNACFHVNCVDPSSRTMVYDDSNSNDENRKQSGCKAGGKSICNQMPFSQRFHDPLNNKAGDLSINCDEWPMATVKQSPFTEGTIRNSLRCIPATENSRGGGQLQSFLEDTGDNPGKTCSGKIQNDDHWTVDFDLNDAEPTKMGYCVYPQDCEQGPYEFHMTKLRNSVHFPLDVDNDNMYTITKNDAEIWQCSVIVNRQGDESFHAEVYNEKNEMKGQNDGGLHYNTDLLTVQGLSRDLILFKNGPLGTDVYFNYGAHKFADVNLANDFLWDSSRTGSSKSFKEDGSYCEVGGVDHNSQSIKCYFPCGPK